MSADRPRPPSLTREYFENQEKVTPEMLWPYRGNFIAWSRDGKTILDFAPEREELWAKLEAAGHDSGLCPIEWIYPYE